MNAVISGKAGRALLLDNDKISLLDADVMGEPASVPSADLGRYFPEGDDLQFLENISLEEARRALSLASACDKALLFALIVLDKALKVDIRSGIAEELDKLLCDNVVSRRLSGILYAKPLPESADIEGALEACKSIRASVLLRLYGNLKNNQPHISRVCQAFDNLPGQLFGSNESRHNFQRIAIEQGLFYDFVTEIAQTGGPYKFQFQASRNPVICKLPNNVKIMESWVAPIAKEREAPSVRTLRTLPVTQAVH